MEKTFLVKRSDGKEVEISETLTKQLGRQVEVVGEITGTRFRKKGTEKEMSAEEFRKKHFHTEQRPDGKNVRSIDSGFERVHDIDKTSRPGSAQYTQGAYRDRKVNINGREMDRKEWEATR